MSIILITGVPGAGKTSYAAQKWLATEVGRDVKLEDETCIKLGMDLGTVVQRRLVVAGFRGLILDHAMLPHALTRNAPSALEVERWNRRKMLETDEGKRVECDEPEHERLPGDPPVDVPAMAQNWWLWCQPGDFIAIDEAQFSMPRGTLGRKPPYWLQAMEIHRHYGVDFLIVTQHPQLIDTTVRALVGHHQHVRSIMGTSMCAVYSWDHASNPERFNLANKKLWRRGPKAYRLYHSSVAHIAAPTSGRGVFIALPLMVAAVGFLGYRFMNKYSPTREQQVATADAAAKAPSGPLGLPTLTPSSSPTVGPAKLASEPPEPAYDAGRVAGCYATVNVCRCDLADGRRVTFAPGQCEAAAARGFVDLVPWQRSVTPRQTFAYGAQAQGGVSAPIQ